HLRRPSRTRLRSGSGAHDPLTPPRPGHSPVHSSIGTPSPVCTGSDRPRAPGFRHSFTPLAGVLFTVPSRYYSAIGRRRYSRLGAWSPRLPTPFPVQGGTHAARHARCPGAAYGALTRCGRPFQAVPLPRTHARGAARAPADPSNPPAAQGVRPFGRRGLGRSRFRSPLLPASRLLLPPRATE